MLTPEDLEQAGLILAAVYSEIEAEMIAELVEAMLDAELGPTYWRAELAMAALRLEDEARLRKVIEDHRDDVEAAIRREVEDAMGRSDARDLEALKAALGVELEGITTEQTALVCRTVAEMIGRDNVEMLEGARQAYHRETSWALMQTATGHMSHNEATERATLRLARHGIDMVQYRDPTTGDRTVRNRADVAVRRHVRSQIAQECAKRTERLCQQAGATFVEVSSHYGARPSHQDWEGRVYSLKGRVTVEGVTYEDFWEATGYEGLRGDHTALGDRLCGVNCRHHFGPWAPGLPRAYHPNPEHPSGRSNDEIYRLTQQQRARERALRDTKRELAAALRCYEADPCERTQRAANELKARLKTQQDRLKAFVKKNEDVLVREPKREWAGDMPRVRVPRDKEER